MDIEANLEEQAVVAAEIMAAWDQCPENGEPTSHQLDAMYHMAYRLAELVQAAAEWEARTHG